MASDVLLSVEMYKQLVKHVHGILGPHDTTRVSIDTEQCAERSDRRLAAHRHIA